jgi:hypothetical protein
MKVKEGLLCIGRIQAGGKKGRTTWVVRWENVIKVLYIHV